MKTAEDIKEARVLVIDDEPDIITYLEALLEDHGFEVLSANDGTEGLQKAKAEKPDLITLDITMPGKSGTEVFRLLRTDPETMGIPVFIITGVMEFRQFIYQRSIAPPEGYMEKPINPSTLLLSIERILAGVPIRETQTGSLP